MESTRREAPLDFIWSSTQDLVQDTKLLNRWVIAELSQLLQSYHIRCIQELYKSSWCLGWFLCPVLPCVLPSSRGAPDSTTATWIWKRRRNRTEDEVRRREWWVRMPINDCLFFTQPSFLLRSSSFPNPGSVDGRREEEEKDWGGLPSHFSAVWLPQSVSWLAGTEHTRK